MPMDTNNAHRSSNSLSETSSFKNGRASLDSDYSGSASSPVIPHAIPNGHSDDYSSLDPITNLRRELDRTREEKDALAEQYRSLLSKLSTMRTTLGNKIKQDAEELDRQEQLVQQLTTQNEDLASTIETLKEELLASHEESERVARQLDSIRTHVMEENAQEILLRERDLRESQAELERCRLDRQEWERSALQERALLDDLRSNMESLRSELDHERDVRKAELTLLHAEREKATNLQSVLQDFQAAKDHEMRQAIKGRDSQLTEVTQSLAEFKHRALTAEEELEQSRSDIARTQELEQEVKEKTLLIGKLRHETVIINEHLMEALRRLRRSASETNVDRRLVTNILLSFLSTPRADPKRFEMLSLLSTILSWTDLEREKAGLQRAGSATGHTPGMMGKPKNILPAKNLELDRTDETESFSRLWVEFLLTEANSGDPPEQQPRDNTSLPGTPTRTGSPMKTRRLASLTNGIPGSSNLTLNIPSPSRKGKEKGDES